MKEMLALILPHQARFRLASALHQVYYLNKKPCLSYLGTPRPAQAPQPASDGLQSDQLAAELH